MVQEEAVDADTIIGHLETHFLRHRAERVNDETWNTITYQFLMKRENEIFSQHLMNRCLWISSVHVWVFLISENVVQEIKY